MIVIPVVQTDSTYFHTDSVLLSPIWSQYRVVEGIGRLVNALASLKTHPVVGKYRRAVPLRPNVTVEDKRTDDTLICSKHA